MRKRPMAVSEDIFRHSHGCCYAVFVIVSRRLFNRQVAESGHKPGWLKPVLPLRCGDDARR
ncbi:hypothetical protein CCHOA_11185 [Corynebacterium choanae]|uniref:Uncharacterized protein n=1 Tax=Corynebacterium choanae TaxID=1862358 RepID=A0A3G6JA12_9CORY|nr:hypothetical protein CCHOA_11185 [Corynebacterium choanae]